VSSLREIIDQSLSDQSVRSRNHNVHHITPV